MEGLITKLVAGVYTVEAGGCILECKAKGTFRKLGISPLVGDLAQVSLRETGYHSIDSLLPRRNSLCRPPLANLDQLFIVVSAAEPAPNFQVIDRMTAAADDQEITPVLVITKTDLAPYEEIVRIYTHAGFDVVITSAASGKGVMEVKKRLAGKISAFAGNTGVGKSTLLNRLDPVLALQTGEISPKLGRGAVIWRIRRAFLLLTQQAGKRFGRKTFSLPFGSWRHILGNASLRAAPIRRKRAARY